LATDECAGTLETCPTIHLKGFQLAGPRLFFVQDERRLVALDIFHGDLLWNSWAPAGRFQLPSPSGRFWSFYHAGEESVVVQTGVGKWLVLDSRTGRRLRESAQPCPPWPQQPLRLDESHVCLLRDPEHLALLESKTGTDVWTYSVENPTSLTGEALQVRGNRDALLVLVSRNHGYFLECLDTRTGGRRWPKARFLGLQPADLAGGSLDDTAVYLVQNNRLLAHALSDGRLLWKRTLPAVASHWHMVRTRNALIAFPRDGRTVQWQWRWLFMTAQLRLTFPSGGGDLSVLVCDPRTGRLAQRLSFPLAVPSAALRCRFDLLPAVMPQLSRLLLPSEEPDIAVQVSECGMIVESNGQAWVLKRGSQMGFADHGW
jgi:hypothetical protein